MDKLTDFGHTFQIKSISALMKNQTFLEQIHDILDEKHFDSDGLKWIVKECKKYYDEYRKCITLDVFKVKTSEVENDVLKLDIDPKSHSTQCEIQSLSLSRSHSRSLSRR